MKKIFVFLLILALACASTFVFGLDDLYAGPYSTAQNNTTVDAIDPAIPGFVNGSINPAFVAWASECVSYQRAAGSGTAYSDTSKALGAVTGSNTHIVSLGDLTQTQIDAGVAPGEITLGFDVSIVNGIGADFAVFENGFTSGSKLFAELAYVEVSTNGVNFARFPSVSLTEAKVDAYGTLDPTGVYNLAGKHAGSYGTPFDLECLLNDPLVMSSLLDLNNINYVKFVDIPGSGNFYDSADPAHPIYDAWVTTGSGGLDLEAVGVLNAVPEPGMVMLLFGGAMTTWLMRRKKSK